MNYLPRSEFECRRKVRHATEAKAKQAEKRARARGAEWIKVYRCRYCEGYHLGHVTNWKQLTQLARDRGLDRYGTIVNERTGE